MTMNNSSIYSFKRILNEYLIYVPSFQRNYIQGSDEFKDKRDRLLDDIFESLKSRKVIDLGFVYGRSEKSYKGRLFYPYDGQQRLTTLYFLYLMLYFRNIRNGEKESIKGLKGKLSYQTRQSTDRFINSFIDWIYNSMENEYDLFWNPNNKSSAFIKIQDCFFDYDWEYDVSIKNILSLIDTLKIRILNLENEIAIDEIINLIDDKEDDNPFKFIFIHIDDIIQNDELYIKINARGKALSHFENLKSDINNLWRNEDYKSKLDGAWTEYVWKESSKDSDSGTIEERFDSDFYNSFKNIFYLNYLSNIERPLTPAFINEIKYEWDNVFNKGKINKDWENKASCDVISYFFDAVSHPNYLFEKQADGYGNLLFKENPGYVECLKIFVYYYLISNIYKSRNCVTDLEIVLFDEILTLFKRLIDNQDKYLDSIDSLIKAIKSSKYLIDKSIESNGILNFLQSNEVVIRKLLGLRKEQIEEEILKARLIYKDKRFIDLFEKGYNELRNKGQLGFIFYLIKNNNKLLRNIRTEDISYESFEKTLNQIISIQSFTGDFISNRGVIFNPNYELLLRAILAKIKDHFFWEKSNNLLSFPLLNDDRDMSLHTFLNCYSSNNPEDVKYKFNLLDGLREVLNLFDPNKDNIEEVLKRIIEDYKKTDSNVWYKFFVIYDGVFKQCRNGNIYHYSDKYVLLLDKKFRSGKWWEYYTFALSRALSEALNKEYHCEKANGLDGGREASFVKIYNMNEIEYRCSMRNDKDSFIIENNEKEIFNSDASLDSWNEWKKKSLKILKEKNR